MPYKKVKKIIVPKDTMLIIYQVPRYWSLKRMHGLAEICGQLNGHLTKEHKERIHGLVIYDDVKVKVIRK